ncbi:MAG: M20/M25/M40 family metallo-hydrolase, partial [Pseudomonadota bacterium]
DSGAVHGQLGKAGAGRHILLYAPIDTHLSGTQEHDVPWVGQSQRADMVPAASTDLSDYIVGLGASNPKSMIATLVEAMQAIVSADLELPGTLSVATAGGGMPWRPENSGGAGLSSGVAHLLSHGLRPDAAVIMKPWDDVYYEHPGMAWFKVTVHGDLGYAGIPHGVPGFRNSIAPAARLISSVQDWLERYPERHESQQVRPEGWIGAVQAGWPDKPAFPPAATQFWVDIRLSPNQSLEALCQEFQSLLDQAMADDPSIIADWTLDAAIPPGRTDPDHWIVQNARASWEAQHGKAYPGAPKMAGQTDAAMLALHNVPTVRIGFPFLDPDRTPQAYRDGLGGMGVAYVPDLIHATQMAVRLALTSLFDIE